MLTEPYTAYRNTLQKSVLMMYTELYQMRTAMHRSYSTMYRRLATAHNICTHRLCIIYNLCIVGLHLYTNILTVLCLVQRICIATEPRPSSVRVWYWDKAWPLSVMVWYWDYIYKVWPSSMRVWYTEKHMALICEGLIPRPYEVWPSSVRVWYWDLYKIHPREHAFNTQ